VKSIIRFVQRTVNLQEEFQRITAHRACETFHTRNVDAIQPLGPVADSPTVPVSPVLGRKQRILLLADEAEMNLHALTIFVLVFLKVFGSSLD
jgi:hypothetical protein